ncbi:Ran-binding protein [Grosmannia clavigera kw1407]|uniref:Ran-binding protein n=1 Tax=Grosmannia clavigera (strain kw1407 / UAMH 11150) TaxID=655863 RepID=F0XSN4_GROCL|nr:Ran-binding protein [Grosmannia clavigera kw1407]EFW99218.1 Ran-binding protein [Grosmannia clavigera kw1407]
METPQRRQKSWLSSLTGLVSGSRSSAQDTASGVAAGVITGKKTENVDSFSYRLRSAQAGHTTPSRYSGTFSAPPVESPESPVKRASPSQLAQRKMHERAQGPSGRAGAAAAHSSSARGESNKSYHSVSFDSHLATTPKRTNFPSATTPKNVFRDSMSRDVPAFTFTPRVPANTMRGGFPATTPGRSFRSSGIELSSQEMAKTSFSDLFAMKIPDPDPKLSGEAIAGMVPKDLKAGSRSVYANEYLAHLCPPDFSEEQRNQFFCILDLRRLKYAADEVFVKKDWKLNILNFAKEYEKNRSLIMLRYGLYEFKTVKVSKDVFQKWKADNNIPDLMEEDELEDTMTSKSTTVPKASKLNGTEGILQSGKRKAQDVIDPAAMESSSSTFSANKRSRPSEGFKAEREPLTETSTPLNQSKRKAAQNNNAEQIQRSKMQKATPNPPSAATSATRALFEKYANSPSKEPAATETPSILVSKPFGESGSSLKAAFKPNTTGQLPKSSSGSLARSVLESGLKTNAGPAGGNIFGYLSDASSAKGSGNDNADADAEDSDESDGQEEPEAQVSSDSTGASANGITNATAKSAPSLFSAAKPASLVPGATGALAGSSASSDVSESAAGRSLFDRVNKTSDGQPIRVFGAESNSSPFGTSAFGAKGAPERPSLEKEPALFGGNKTWSADTPIKFAGGNSSTPAKSLFGASTTNSGPASAASTTPNLFASASKESKSDAPPSLFGSVSALKEPKSAAPTSLFGSAAAAPKDTKVDAPVSLFGSKTPATLFGNTAKDAPQFTSTTPAASTADAQPTEAPLFGFSNKPAGPSTPAAPSLFGASTAGSGTPATSLFGKAQEKPATTTATSLFGNAAGTSKTASGSVLQSHTLFGGAPKPELEPQGLKRTADDKGSSSAAATSGASLFGGALQNGTSSKDEPQAKRPLFGSTTPSSQAPSSAPLFSFGSTSTNGVSGGSKVPGETAKSLFGSTINGSAAEPAKTQATSLFGSTTTAAANPVSGSIFNFGNTNSSAAPPVPSSFSIGASTAAQDSAPPAPIFGGGNTVSAPSSFTFSVGGDTSNQGFHNPFSFGGAGAEAAPSLSFGGVASATVSSSAFQFGATTTPAVAPPASGGMSFSFGAGAQPSSQPVNAAPGNLFGATPAASGGANGSSMFSFGGGAQAQPSNTPIFGQQQQQPALGGSMFNLAPPVGGTSTGTNTPFTNLGGASSLATTPATGTPEPGAAQDNSDHNGHQADGDEAPQEQINLTEGGPGEEDEAVAYEVRAKALRLASAKETDGGSPAAKDKKNPWKTEGVGSLRVLKHKTTGAVRLLLRAEPRGNVALNRVLLADFNYKPEPNAKYVKLTTSNEAGTGLETWMLQVKTKEAAQKLAEALEEHKLANKNVALQEVQRSNSTVQREMDSEAVPLEANSATVRGAKLSMRDARVLAGQALLQLPI